MQLAQRLAQILEQGGVHRGSRPQNTTCCADLNPEQRRVAVPLRSSVMVSPTLRVGHLLDLGGDEADFAGAPRSFPPRLSWASEDADLLDLIDRVGVIIMRIFWPFFSSRPSMHTLTSTTTPR